MHTALAVTLEIVPIKSGAKIENAPLRKVYQIVLPAMKIVEKVCLVRLNHKVLLCLLKDTALKNY